MSNLDNPLIKKGMTAQLAARRVRIAAGETPLGWKVGFGAPAAMQKLGLSAPLVGYLMQRALLLSGSTVSLRDYVKPVAEPEIAVRMLRDLGPGASPNETMTAIKEIMPALELADLDPRPAPDNLDAILEGAGASLADVVKCGVFLKDGNDFAAMNEIYIEFFGEQKPARTTVEAKFANPDIKIEIDAIAYKPK